MNDKEREARRREIMGPIWEWQEKAERRGEFLLNIVDVVAGVLVILTVLYYGLQIARQL